MPTYDRFDEGARRERPGDSLIDVRDTPDETFVAIPPRPLILPLKLLLMLHVCLLVFLFTVGVLYLFFHISIFTGMPEPSRVFRAYGSKAAEYRWDVEVAFGWIASLTFMTVILGLVWIPQIANESLTFDRHGFSWRRDGWWKHERLSGGWNELNEIVLLGSLQDIAPNRLVIQLFDGRQQPIAENTSNAERAWLESLLDATASKHRGI